jgi:hypothetical protein
MATGGELSYAVNRFVNFTTFVQADTAQIQAVSANLRLRYTFRPDSDLYVLQRWQPLPESRGREPDGSARTEIRSEGHWFLVASTQGFAAPRS